MNEVSLLVLTSTPLIALNVIGWLLLKKDADYLQGKGLRAYVTAFLVMSSLSAFLVIGAIGFYLYGIW